MSVVQRELVVVRFEDDVPERLVCGGVRYRVTDIPTRLEDEMAALTHPLAITGWRFQGTDGEGTSRVFDICRSGGGWALLRSYE